MPFRPLSYKTNPLLYVTTINLITRDKIETHLCIPIRLLPCEQLKKRVVKIIGLYTCAYVCDELHVCLIFVLLGFTVTTFVTHWNFIQEPNGC